MNQKQILLTPWKIFQKSVRFKSRSTFSNMFMSEVLTGSSESTEQESKPTPNLKNDHNFNFLPFNEFIETRRQAAKRSVLVQVKSEHSANDLLAYCGKKFGRPKSLHYHTNDNSEEFSNFFIVEFEDSDVVEEIIVNHARHRDDSKDHFPVCSPFLWLSQEQQKQQGQANVDRAVKQMNVPLILPEDNSALSNNRALIQILNTKSTINEQIMLLFEAYKMSSTSEKLRFLACEQVERCLKGLYPNTKIMPFGSSVNSFGKCNSDLDMCILHNQRNLAAENSVKSKNNSRLVFHSKRMSHSNRNVALSYCGFAMQHMLPGCQNVEQIYNCRVPIVKFRHDFLNLECDLSQGSSGVEMSSLLYLWGNLDDRVRPLVFVVRKWAKENGLVPQLRPTSFFTNFPLTLMVIFYLQSKTILPSLNQLRELATDEDHVICDDGTRASFLRDVRNHYYDLNGSYRCPEVASLSLTELLKGFFEFYGLFDYQNNGICVISGKEIRRRRIDAILDVVNPMEPNLNTSVFVQEEALMKFRRLCHQACRKLQYLDSLQEFGHELEAHQGGNKLMFLISNQQLPSGMASENDLGSDSGMKTSRKQKRNKRRLQLPGATDLFKIE